VKRFLESIEKNLESQMALATLYTLFIIAQGNDECLGSMVRLSTFRMLNVREQSLLHIWPGGIGMLGAR
jgi:hypothetical protein